MNRYYIIQLVIFIIAVVPSVVFLDDVYSIVVTVVAIHMTLTNILLKAYVKKRTEESRQLLNHLKKLTSDQED